MDTVWGLDNRPGCDKYASTVNSFLEFEKITENIKSGALSVSHAADEAIIGQCVTAGVSPSECIIQFLKAN